MEAVEGGCLPASVVSLLTSKARISTGHPASAVPFDSLRLRFKGNFVNLEMVKAFITSSEYRQRFGP